MKTPHAYSRVRSRGPENGINTLSDLESEIRNQVSDESASGNKPNRRTITLPILNHKGQHLLAIYDYDGKSTSKCEMVTRTYPAEYPHGRSAGQAREKEKVLHGLA